MSERPWIKALFVLTLGVSSATLFILQPMCARIVLPHLGGSPSVWTTCMLFFQAGLLCGYLYAHASGWIGLRTHTVVHLGLLLAACAFLPPFAGRAFFGESSISPSVWLLAILVGSVGLPCLVLASSAPLLQVWLARARSGAQRDPYFLYAASNAGSLLGLLAYPFLLEPFLTLRQQGVLWSACFALFAVLTAICALVASRTPPAHAASPSGQTRASKASAKKKHPITDATIARWLFLAFLPSSLLLSVTVHLTADVASIPFLWVVPLGLYLLTYIFAFSARGSGNPRFWVRWLPLVVLVLVVVLLTEATEPLLLIVLLHLVGLFWIGMLCHGELARSRPPVTHLTTFYLCIAVGGALGGVVNALIAPAVFHSLAEYPLALVLAFLVPALGPNRPQSSRRAKNFDLLFPVLLVGFTAVLAVAVPRMGIPAGPVSVLLIFGIPLIVCYTFSARPMRFALGIAGILLASHAYPGVHGKSDARIRSFFGVHRVTNDGSYRILVHGNTEHGRQSLDPARQSEPLAYYFRNGPFGDLLSTLAPDDARLRNVAVVGLGAGALAAYAQRDQNWTFYEIDPSVVFIARESGYFTYLRDATRRGAKLRVVQGDGRFQLGRSEEPYGLIVLDAFGSDSIPTHLFTREALDVYRTRLSDKGLIAIHYSSRYFDLRPVLGALANSAQPPLIPLFRDDLSLTDADKAAGKAPSRWAVFARSSEDPVVGALLDAGWQAIQPDGSAAPWTDDHANVLRILQLIPESGQ
jgi:hypothetical protein